MDSPNRNVVTLGAVDCHDLGNGGNPNGGSLRLLDEDPTTPFITRVCYVYELPFACYDKDGNQVPFRPGFEQLRLRVTYNDLTVDLTDSTSTVLSTDRLTATIDVKLMCSDLDKIRPNYGAIMHLSTADELYSVSIPIKVFPGMPRRALLNSASFNKRDMVPGEVIQDMILEVFDEYNNHVQEELITLKLDGLRILGGRSLIFRTDQEGCVDLSGTLQVVKGFGERGSFSVTKGQLILFEEAFQTSSDHCWNNLTIHELEAEIAKTGSQNKEAEMKINSLANQQSKIKESIARMQEEYVVLFERNPHRFISKQQKIAGMSDSAAAIICNSSHQALFGEKILGVVACIGSVPSNNVSRMLSHYLGKDNMLRIVCEDAVDPQICLKIQALAAELQMSLPKIYAFAFIKDISPYSGPISEDPRRELQIPNPCLPSGECPPGFIGYAVNLIELDPKLMPWRTASGHGLRETLLYQLFSELQVYDTIYHMMLARSCITSTALSLDGVILRGDGGVTDFVTSDAEIQFSVCSRDESALIGRIEANKRALREIEDSLDKEKARHEEIQKRFQKQQTRHNALLSEMFPHVINSMPMAKPEPGTSSQI